MLIAIIVSCNKILPTIYNFYEIIDELNNFILRIKTYCGKNFKYNTWIKNNNKNESDIDDIVDDYETYIIYLKNKQRKFRIF